MAKIKNSLFLEGMSGTLGKNLVFRQMKDGRTIVSAKPDFSHRKFSHEQLSHQQRFREAVAYARHAAKTNLIYQELAKGTTKTAYNIALSDWFSPPVIQRIRQQAGHILIEATDNVLVAKVTVKIMAADGKMQEQGNAVLVKAPLWEYAITQTGKVVVEAYDMAGNRTSQEALVE